MEDPIPHRTGYAVRRDTDPPGEAYGPSQQPGGPSSWLLAVIQTLGLPTALVIFFLLQNAGYIPSETRQIVAAVEAGNLAQKVHQQQDAMTKKQIADGLDAMVKVVESNNRIVRAICTTMGGRDPDIRRACLGMP